MIVVADSCTDETAAIAWAAGATIVLETAFADKAGAQNQALPLVRSEVVVGIDGDTMPQPGCIPLMIADIAAGADATCSTVLPLQPSGFFIDGRRFAYALGRRWWRLCQAKVGRIQVLTGASYAFRASAMRSIGGFPSGLISADMDATWALHRARKKLVYTGAAVALTVDPETFKVYRAQMRRWAAGYFQNVWRYRREVLHWRSLLVIGTALLDLGCLFGYEAGFGIAIAFGHYWVARDAAIWLAVHAVVTTALVASVVGPRDAMRGYVPYLVLNYYNKWLYLCAFVREWILGRHYAAWTGRQGRKTVITPMTRARKLGLSCSALAIVAAVGGVAGLRDMRQAGAPAAAGPAPAATEAGTPTRFAGIVTDNLPDFDRACGCRPDLAVRYVPWGMAPGPGLASSRVMLTYGAEPLIELSPYGISLGSIVDGGQDRWLRQWAVAIRNLRAPVLLSFAPEANGSWYAWGYHRTTAATYVAAWRHVVTVFRREGVRQATWIWIINRMFRGSEPLRTIWPGSGYVNMVGIDGYFLSRTDTFASLFAPTMAAVREFTAAPVMISETAADPAVGKAQAMAALIRGVARYGLGGFIWFDINQADKTGANADDWRIETSPDALAEFRRETAAFVTTRAR